MKDKQRTCATARSSQPNPKLWNTGNSISSLVFHLYFLSFCISKLVFLSLHSFLSSLRNLDEFSYVSYIRIRVTNCSCCSSSNVSMQVVDCELSRKSWNVQLISRNWRRTHGFQIIISRDLVQRSIDGAKPDISFASKPDILRNIDSGSGLTGYWLKLGLPNVRQKRGAGKTALRSEV